MPLDSPVEQLRSHYVSSSIKVLVVDDEQSIRRSICVGLAARGFATDEARTGAEALERVAQGTQLDVILLDLGLPDFDGIEVTRRIRQSIQTPIIIISVRDGESDKVAALDAGADDYLTKPYESTRLLERIAAALLRTTVQEKQLFDSGGLRVELDHNAVRVRGHAVNLPHYEYKLLKVLAFNVGRLLTHRQIIREVWGETPSEEGLRRLRTTMSSVRQILEADPIHPRYIGTESGVGYRIWTQPV
jgi:two-component system, OmpR family, KDP operon response regulator KdpE